MVLRQSMIEQDSGPWQAFTGVHYQGNSIYLYPGSYEDLNEARARKFRERFS